MKYAITAQAFDRVTGAVRGKARVEVIDTTTNSIFSGAFNIMEVRGRYEAFWNNLNPRSADVVFVARVRPIAIASPVRVPLGRVVGALISAAESLANDAISELYGFYPDPRPALRQIAANLGWTYKEIEQELTRRGVSEYWQFKQGLGIILDEEVGS